MKKRITLALSLVLAVPMLASAQTTSNDRVMTLYSQLAGLLRQQVLLLQQAKHPAVSIIQAATAAPSTVVFTVRDRTGTESIDFGDGHSTGSNGCVKNEFGWCDLSTSVSHLYATPAAYEVTLYSHVGGHVQTLSTSTVTVTK